MAIELVVPTVGESITEVEVGEWLKKPGDHVEVDDPIVEIESDKATVEIFAPSAGTITEILIKTGEPAKVGDVVGKMEEGGNGGAAKQAEKKSSAKSEEKQEVKSDAAAKSDKPAEKTSKKQKDQAEVKTEEDQEETQKEEEKDSGEEVLVMPAAQRLIDEHDLNPAEIDGTGKGGRILKEDVQNYVDTRKEDDGRKKEAAPDKAAPAPRTGGNREEEAVRMSPMRRTIARTLVKAQQDMALLTTFNEIDMSAVVDLRNQFKDPYAKQYDIKLGFMSFFVKACVEALKAYPAVNAEVRGDEAVYRNYYDIGIAVGGGRGLVVPNLRNAERMSFAEIELAIADFGKRAQANKIALDELEGGTFTITNGGIYGSMMSTPIINPPQSGILGMHAIQDRPVVREGQIVVRPMMYVALTYDHRIVDGREAVSFLVKVKECVENPNRILLEI